MTKEFAKLEKQDNKFKMLFVLFILSIIVIAGCNQQSPNTSQSGAIMQMLPAVSKGKAICGNGLVENGETKENCCLDVSCDEFFVCKELQQDGKTINTCAKSKLEETKDYKNLLGYLDEENREYEKESNLINYDNILTKINQMNRTVAKLSSAYDLSLEQIYVKYRYERRDWNVNRGKVNEQISKTRDEDTQKQLFAKIIELDKQELQRLRGFTDEQVEKIKTKFDYDIIERRDTLAAQIKDEEKFLDLANKGYQVELSVIDYNPKCSDYSNECFLEYTKTNIKNVGELELQKPTFDFYIMKGDTVLSRDVDKYDYNLDAIPIGFEGVFKTNYIGYDNQAQIPKGTYTLKVNLKQGVSTKVIATTSTTIKMI